MTNFKAGLDGLLCTGDLLIVTPLEAITGFSSAKFRASRMSFWGGWAMINAAITITLMIRNEIKTPPLFQMLEAGTAFAQDCLGGFN
jgi:hypothetical protein